MKTRTIATILVLATLLVAGSVAWAVSAQTPTAKKAVSPATSSLAAKAATDSAPATPRTITVVGSGSVKIKPDMAVVNLGVQTFGASVKAATAEASDTMEQLLAQLKAMGVDEKDIQTSGYNVWADANYGVERQPGAEVQYRVNNTVAVVVRDLDAIGPLLDAAIEAGANAIHGISFGLAEPDASKSEARSQAVANALANAQELAELNGLELGQVLAVSEVIENGFVGNNFEAMAMATKGLGGGAGPVSPGELELTTRIQVVYAIH